jgi:hypothetical protein
LKRWSIVAVVVLAVGGLLVARRRDPPKARVGPALAVRTAPARLADDSASEDRAVALAVSSLSTAERKRLLDAMDYAATRLEGSAMPGTEDLGEGDAVAELETKTKKYGPALSAARSLARGRWSNKDLSARVVATCDDPSIAADERCVPLWEETPESSRARFLAWAAANATVFETESPFDCVTALREHALDEGSPVALVLGADDLALAEIPERNALKDVAHRLGRMLAVTERKDEGRQLEALGRTPPAPGRALAWLDVTPKTVVIVPRLSALTRLGELPASVERLPACRPSRWIHRGGG